MNQTVKKGLPMTSQTAELDPVLVAAAERVAARLLALGEVSARVLGLAEWGQFPVDTASACVLTVSGGVDGRLAAVVADGALPAPAGESAAAALARLLAEAVPALSTTSGPLVPGASAEVPARSVVDLTGMSAQRIVGVFAEDRLVLALVLTPESAAAAAAASPPPASPGGAFTPMADAPERPPVDPRRLHLLRDVEMGISVELGRTRMTVRDLLSLAPGVVIELDRAAGSPVDVLVNGTLIGRGEVVVVDEEFAVRVTEVLSPDIDPLARP